MNKNLKQLSKLGKEIIEKSDIIIYSENSKNGKLLTEFSRFCADNPDLRFWQALCVWSKSGFILKADSIEFDKNKNIYSIKDTFYEK